MTCKQELLKCWTDAIDDNAEQQLHAQALLDEAIEENAASLPQVLTLFQKVTAAAKKRRHWAYLLLTVGAVILFVAQWRQAYLIQQNFISSRGVSGLSSGANLQIKTQSAEETLLLYGDPQRVNKGEQLKALWESDPDNPVYFAEYVRNYAVASRALPADCHKIADAIDPDNGYYHLLDAALRAKPLFTKTKTDHPKSPVTRSQVMKAQKEDKKRLELQQVNQFTINDPVQAKQVLDSWRKSLQKPHYESHKLAIHKQRAVILHRRYTWLDQFAPIVYIFGLEPLTTDERDLADLLVASLQAADFSTPEGQQFFRDVSTYAERIATRQDSSLVDVLVKFATLLSFYRQIAVLETDALDPILVARWKARHEALMNLRLELISRPSPEESVGEKHGSLISGLLLPSAHKQTRNPPVVSMADLAPMRYADHCLVGRALISSYCLILLCMIPYHLLWRRKAFMHRLTYEVWQAVPLRSVIGLVLCAVFLPTMIYVLLTWFTPLTGKEWSITYKFLFPAVPVTSLVLLLWIMPRLLVGMAIKPWLKLSCATRVWYQRCGWFACVLLLLPLLGMTWVAAVDWQKQTLLILLGICWLPALLWLVAGGIKGINGRSFYEQVMSGLRRRIVGVCTVCSLMVLSVAGLILPKVESYWVQRDQLLAIDQNLPTTTNEAQVIESIQNDLREALGLGAK